MKFKWPHVEKNSFDDIKYAVALKNLLSYPYFDKQSDIHTDASDFQLGVKIIQEGKLIKFYRRKVMDAQMRYIITGD